MGVIITTKKLKEAYTEDKESKTNRSQKWWKHEEKWSALFRRKTLAFLKWRKTLLDCYPQD